MPPPPRHYPPSRWCLLAALAVWATTCYSTYATMAEGMKRAGAEEGQGRAPAGEAAKLPDARLLYELEGHIREAERHVDLGLQDGVDAGRAPTRMAEANTVAAKQSVPGARFDGDDGVTPSLYREVISFEPRAFVFPRLLSDDECDAIVEAAGSLSSQNHGAYKDVRTSSNQKINFQTLNKPDIKHALRRVANASGISVGHFEGIEVIRYDEGQKYQSHHDYFAGPGNTILKQDDRIATMLIYLKEPDAGGETIFPWADTGTEIGENGWPKAFHDYTKECESLRTYDDELPRGKKVIPQKGSALLFFNYNHLGLPDPYSQHGGCPVRGGVKYTATVWMWGKPHGSCPPKGTPLLRGVSEKDRAWNTNEDEPSVCIRA